MRIKELKLHSYLLLLLGSLVVFVISTFLALDNSIKGAEKSIFDFFYGWGEGFKPGMWLITQLGSAWMFASAVVIYFWQNKKNLSIKLFLGGALTYSLVQIAKVLVDRPRPYLLFSDVVQRDTLASGLGFPSGHTALITFFVITIQPYLHKKVRWIVWLVVAGVAVSRIYLGVHSPLDVVGGAAVGASVAYTIKYFLQRRFLNHSA